MLFSTLPLPVPGRPDTFAPLLPVPLVVLAPLPLPLVDDAAALPWPPVRLPPAVVVPVAPPIVPSALLADVSRLKTRNDETRKTIVGTRMFSTSQIVSFLFFQLFDELPLCGRQWPRFTQK
jgi:hypothetical protein